MGFRFRRTLKIAPGIHINLTKSGPSLSLGPRGAKYTIGSRGDRATVGIPGTGLSYTSQSHRSKRGVEDEDNGDVEEQTGSIPVSTHLPSKAESFFGYCFGFLMLAVGIVLIGGFLVVAVAVIGWIVK